jgi:hypothetical protein
VECHDLDNVGRHLLFVCDAHLAVVCERPELRGREGGRPHCRCVVLRVALVANRRALARRVAETCLHFPAGMSRDALARVRLSASGSRRGWEAEIP